MKNKSINMRLYHKDGVHLNLSGSLSSSLGHIPEMTTLSLADLAISTSAQYSSRKVSLSKSSLTQSLLPKTNDFETPLSLYPPIIRILRYMYVKKHICRPVHQQKIVMYGNPKANDPGQFSACRTNPKPDSLLFG
jgi:hypothetical protein